MALGVRLLAPSKARPPQPLRAVLLRLPPGGQQATQFGDTQPDPLVAPALRPYGPFFLLLLGLGAQDDEEGLGQ
jgi:hypothetical protein